jgi:hypothetical protein
MEFLRFGSSIPGSYWGCCAMCIIQNFKVDPDAKASIQLVSGDGGGPIMDTKSKEMLFAGPTYRDIFEQRIRIGTFGQADMPNHGFLAILTDWQISNGVGLKWLKILKENGFEFIRTVDNSVYTGVTGTGYSKPNYVFGLFRNVTSSKIKDPFTPPKAWTDMEQVVPEAWQSISDPAALAKEQSAKQKALWDAGKTKLLTESEVVKAGAPVILAGLRSQYPQQEKSVREQLKDAEAAKQGKAPKAVKGGDPFAVSPVSPTAG